MSETKYEERAEKIMPQFTFWGEGIILIKKEEWYKSRYRIIDILKQLHRAKMLRGTDAGE
jgi:hypothetical protein